MASEEIARKERERVDNEIVPTDPQSGRTRRRYQLVLIQIFFQPQTQAVEKKKKKKTF